MSSLWTGCLRMNEIRGSLSVILVLISLYLFANHVVADAVYAIVWAVWIRGELFNVGTGRVGVRGGGHMLDPGHLPVRRPGNFPKKG